MREHFVVEIVAEWDPEASVWVAHSQNFDGLIIEAESIDELRKRLPGAIVDMLECNGIEASGPEIPYHLMAQESGKFSMAC